MDVKDRRYKTIRNLIAAGYIKTFRQIFGIIAKSQVARDLKTNNGRFTRRKHQVDQFKMWQVFRLADLLEMEEGTVLELLIRQRKEDQKPGSSR